MAEENQEDSNTETAAVPDGTSGAEPSGSPADSSETAAAANAAGVENGGTKRAHRSQKVGAVVSDKMQKTVVVRVDRLVRHMKYRRYVRRTSKFMAHDELGATIGDKVRIVETRPMSARKRWRVIEIVQKAAK
jgi:small subunit ribosomal protein S17